MPWLYRSVKAGDAGEGGRRREEAPRRTDDAVWDAVVERSARLSFGQEHREVLEPRALAALRRGTRKRPGHAWK